MNLPRPDPESRISPRDSRPFCGHRLVLEIILLTHECLSCGPRSCLGVWFQLHLRLPLGPGHLARLQSLSLGQPHASLALLSRLLTSLGLFGAPGV